MVSLVSNRRRLGIGMVVILLCVFWLSHDSIKTGEEVATEDEVTALRVFLWLALDAGKTEGEHCIDYDDDKGIWWDISMTYGEYVVKSLPEVMNDKLKRKHVELIMQSALTDGEQLCSMMKNLVCQSESCVACGSAQEMTQKQVQICDRAKQVQQVSRPPGPTPPGP